MEHISKLLRLINRKGPGAEESDVLTNQTAEYAKDIGDKQAEDPNFKRIMEDPIEALKNNEKLSNAFLKKQKELGLNILDEGDKQHIVDDLTNMIVSMLSGCLAHNEEIDDLEPVNKTNEKIKFTPFVGTKPHHIMHYDNDARLESESSQAVPNVPPINQCDSCDIMTESGNVESSNILLREQCSVYRTENLNASDAFDMNFLLELEREQLILLLKDICHDGKIYRKCKVRHSQLFAEKNSDVPKAKKSKKNKKWYHWS